jgi:oligoribonuclease NrnB/cAMP/cGMP phosphodiesterase (DHH superfamily)
MAAAVVTKFRPGFFRAYACNYGEPVPEIRWIEGDKLFIVDFSFPRHELLALANRLGEVNIQVFDHHRTAEKELEGLRFCHFDQKKCGATLTWNKLRPSPEDPIPKILEYIQDWDLGLRNLPQTKKVNAVLSSHMDKGPRFWLDLLQDFKNVEGRTHWFERGDAILQYRGVMVERICRDPINLMIGGNSVLGAFADRSIGTDVAERLIRSSNLFGAALFTRGTKVEVSLRSGKWGEERIDVSEIAKQYGGGGHKGAAGFMMELEEFVKLIIK